MINNPVIGTPLRINSARLMTMLIQVLLASLVAFITLTEAVIIYSSQ